MKVKGSNGGDYQNPEPGTYVARCIRLVDLGTQYGEYQGKPTAKRQVVIFWELSDELMTEGEYAGQPFVVSKFYTASLNEKATLRHDLVNWRGVEFTPEELAGFDLEKVLGVPCLITLTTNDNGRTKVTGVTKPPKGTKAPKQINPSINFSLEPGEFDVAVYNGLSDWFKETIAKSPEFTEATHGAPTPQDNLRDVDFGNPEDDSIPF